MHRFVLPCLGALIGALACVSTAGAAEYVPGELIVGFEPGVSGAERAAVRAEAGAEVVDVLPRSRSQVLALDGPASVLAAVASLERDPRVAYAEPNWIYRATAVPIDTYFGDLWGLHNTGQAGGLADADIDAPEAWEQPIRDDVTVAVVDTGVALHHPELAARLVPGKDFVDGDDIPADMDFGVSHGTHVAGTIAAIQDNVAGVAGVSRNARIMPLRALDWDGSGTAAWIAAAFTHAAANNVPIVNASLGGPQSNTINNAISASPNTLFVVAAGNCGVDNDAPVAPSPPSSNPACNGSNLQPEHPCSHTAANVLCVAAGDRSDRRASFSNFGRTTVDLAAPGVETRSTVALFGAPLLDEAFDGGFGGRWISERLAGSANWQPGSANASPGDPASPGHAGLISNEQNADTFLRTDQPVDLTGKEGCHVLFDLRLDMATGDTFSVEATTDLAGSWTLLSTRTASTPPASTNPADPPGWTTAGADLGGPNGSSGFSGQAVVHLRFRYRSTSTAAIEAAVDLVQLRCSTADYRTLDGTSMATPHVAGAAAEVLGAFPALTTAALKARLLDTGDLSDCWTGLTVSGRRLNLARAVGLSVPNGPQPGACAPAGANGSGSVQPPPAPPPEPAPAPAPAPPPPPPEPGVELPIPDRIPPALRTTAARIARTASLLRSGLRSRIACDESCRIRADLIVGRRIAQRYGIRGRRYGRRYVLVGRSRGSLTRSGTRTVTTRVSRRARRGLGRARRARLVLRVLATDPSGNTRIVRRGLTVRR